MRRVLHLAVMLALLATPARAVQPDEILADPKLETRARALSRELRCMVCQNQSIDDSDAPLARDLRLLVRERLTAGDSDDKVLAFLRERYGAFVLLKPPFGWSTVLLWIAPASILLTGVAGLLLFLRRRRADPGLARRSITPLSPDEEAEAARLLARAAENNR